MSPGLTREYRLLLSVADMLRGIDGAGDYSTTLMTEPKIGDDAGMGEVSVIPGELSIVSPGGPGTPQIRQRLVDIVSLQPDVMSAEAMLTDIELAISIGSSMGRGVKHEGDAVCDALRPVSASIERGDGGWIVTAQFAATRHQEPGRGI